MRQTHRALECDGKTTISPPEADAPFAKGKPSISCIRVLEICNFMPSRCRQRQGARRGLRTCETTSNRSCLLSRSSCCQGRLLRVRTARPVLMSVRAPLSWCRVQQASPCEPLPSEEVRVDHGVFAQPPPSRSRPCDTSCHHPHSRILGRLAQHLIVGNSEARNAGVDIVRHGITDGNREGCALGREVTK